MLMRRGRRWDFEFKCSDAPAMTKSMHIALHDLGLARIWMLYPGRERYPLHERVEALPLQHFDRPCRELLGQVDKTGKLLR